VQNVTELPENMPVRITIPILQANPAQ